MVVISCCIFVQVAVEKAKGNLPGAIDLLRSYLNVYQTDVGAWEELADLYLQVGCVIGSELSVGMGCTLIGVSIIATAVLQSSAVNHCD